MWTTLDALNDRLRWLGGPKQRLRFSEVRSVFFWAPKLGVLHRSAKFDHDGVRVIRTWIYAAANRGVWRRSLNYASFMVSSLTQGLRRAGDADVIVATSPQFLVGLSGLAASRLRRRTRR